MKKHTILLILLGCALISRNVAAGVKHDKNSILNTPFRYIQF